MAARLGLGVIGLGRRWPRFRHALTLLRRQVEVSAVYDPVVEKTEHEAKVLGCEMAGGVVELLERADVDAVLLAGGPWFGLWPIEQAVRLGKAVLCAASVAQDEAYLDELSRRLPEGARLQLAQWPALEMLVEALAEPLSARLGPVRFVQATWISHQPATEPLTGGALLALLQACATLAEGEATRVQARGAEAEGFTDVVFDFASGVVGQLTLWRGPAARSRCELRVEAENGSAWAELPSRLGWHDAEGRSTRQLPSQVAELLCLDRFVQAVRHGQPLPNSLAAVHQALGWLQAARQALAAGASVVLT